MPALINEKGHLLEYGRQPWIDTALDEFRARGGKYVLEIGSIRSHSLEGDGWSTIAWAKNAKRVWTVDIDPRAGALTKLWTEKYGNVTVVTADALEWIPKFTEVVDLLYLDAWDVGTDNYQENHLKAFELALKNLHERSLVLIDDAKNQGKEFLVVPTAKKMGFEVIFWDYMVLLGRVNYA
jgi:predicted O-methyltransferase YrrM